MDGTLLLLDEKEISGERRVGVVKERRGDGRIKASADPREITQQFHLFVSLEQAGLCVNKKAKRGKCQGAIT